MSASETDLDRLVLPCEDPDEWARIEAVLRRPLVTLADLDDMLNAFAPQEQQPRTCHFFSHVPGTAEAAAFDFPKFWMHGVPLMVAVALEMPSLFAETQVPLLLQGQRRRVVLTRRQCACLLAHSAFGSITSKARRVRKEKWAFRASMLFFLEAIPSALCFLNYFKLLGLNGIPDETVTFERLGFDRGAPPWNWEICETPLCPVEIVADSKKPIEDSPAETHVDFANRFIGGGALENDFMMEEILFAIKPELIVSMALCSFLHDEEAVAISGARQCSCYSGYGHSFQFEGDYDGRRAGSPARVVAMDALQGFARVQFNQGFVLRDLNKARIAFTSAANAELATGNWGCGAFGNDHVLKFLQQWLAASQAGVHKIYYHTFGDKRISELPQLVSGFASLTVGHLYAILLEAAKLGNAAQFRRAILGHATIATAPAPST